MRTTHAQSHDAYNDDQNGNESNDSPDDSDYERVVVTHRLFDLRKFRFNFRCLRNGNAPNDIRFLGRWSCENP